MIEALLFIEEIIIELQPATDMMDVYEGSIPPSAKFQTIDIDSEQPSQLMGVS